MEWKENIKNAQKIYKKCSIIEVKFMTDVIILFSRDNVTTFLKFGID
jgi:hypothetical protein